MLMSNPNLKVSRLDARGTWPYANRRRPCQPAFACKSRQHVMSISAVGSFPSFTFRVTARQVRAAATPPTRTTASQLRLRGDEDRDGCGSTDTSAVPGNHAEQQSPASCSGKVHNEKPPRLPVASTKLRLDTFLATQIAADLASHNEAGVARTADVSRAKVQASIAAGLVQINGRPATKASQQLRPGDSVVCSLPPPPPVQALPEAIPLDIRYEDDHVIVINKPAGMVVHVAPGHYTGTLVNALLHHCALPALDLDLDPNLGGELDPDFHHLDMIPGPGCSSDDIDLAYDGDDDDGDGGDGDDTEINENAFPLKRNGGQTGKCNNNSNNNAKSKAVDLGDHDVGCDGVVVGGQGGSSSLRPGIVHRIDKGTSGLLVVAKTELALTRLQAQFKARTVDRLYESITVGCPAQPCGRVETNVVRDPRDRKRMAAAPYGSGRGRTAGSSYSVVTPLAGGGAALVRWKLDTGRTHQIRVHAKHIGHPLLGDDTYGGTAAAALAVVARNLPADTVRWLVEDLGRPALHARTLGFSHPVTGNRLAFEQPPPEDFRRALLQLGLGAEHLSGSL